MTALDALYREAYTSLRHRALLRSRGADFRVSFYPYAGLKSTIYQRSGHYEVKLGDLLEKASLQVHYSLACILLSKLDRRLRIGNAERLAYDQWSRHPEVVLAHENARRERGTKRLDPPQGAAHDLTLLYHRLNRDYFGALLPRVTLGWSRARSRSIWGHHDDAHKAIVLNRVLDSARVPEFVVESILYHEMLHHKIGPQYGTTGRRILHSREFRRQERLFAHYDEAQRFLKAVASRKVRL
ncbi:MAG: M48 family peptidase [Euryarchaeota archaeon]|nr:M48 family peptidase [Euryarchaeota archaeon]